MKGGEITEPPNENSDRAAGKQSWRAEGGADGKVGEAGGLTLTARPPPHPLSPQLPPPSSSHRSNAPFVLQ